MTGIGWVVPVGLSREDARRRAAAELAKAKYGGRPGWVDGQLDHLQRLLERLITLYGRLVDARQPGHGGVSWGFVIAVALLIGALALVVWRVGLPKWRRRRTSASLQLDAATSATDYRALAEEHARRGDWAAAVRDRFRGVVRELETRTIVSVRPAWTAWEAARSAARLLPEATDALSTGADLFSRVVYGEQPADAGTYAQLVAVDDTVLAAADRVDLADAAPVAG